MPTRFKRGSTAVATTENTMEGGATGGNRPGTRASGGAAGEGSAAGGGFVSLPLLRWFSYPPSKVVQNKAKDQAGEEDELEVMFNINTAEALLLGSLNHNNNSPSTSAASASNAAATTGAGAGDVASEDIGNPNVNIPPLDEATTTTGTTTDRDEGREELTRSTRQIIGSKKQSGAKKLTRASILLSIIGTPSTVISQWFTNAGASPPSEPLSPESTDPEDATATTTASITASDTEDIRPRSTATTASVTASGTASGITSGSTIPVNPLAVETSQRSQAKEHQERQAGQGQTDETSQDTTPPNDTTQPSYFETSPYSSPSVSTTTITTLERELTQRSTSVSIDDKDKYLR